MEHWKLHDENEDGDEALLSLAQRLLISQSFSEEDIAEWMNTDEQEEITADMIEDIMENREQESSNTENDVNQNKMKHSKGLSLNSIGKTLNTF